MLQCPQPARKLQKEAREEASSVSLHALFIFNRPQGLPRNGTGAGLTSSFGTFSGSSLGTKKWLCVVVCKAITCHQHKHRTATSCADLHTQGAPARR